MGAHEGCVICRERSIFSATNDEARTDDGVGPRAKSCGRTEVESCEPVNRDEGVIVID